MTDTADVTALTLQTAALKTEMADLSRMAEGFGQTIVRAFAGAIIHGRKLSDVLKGLALSLANQALSAALRPLGNLLGSALGQVTASAHGNLLQMGRIQPFAAGGIVSSPTLFALRGRTGLMGEAGPEAIMPLARGPDGKLGVRGQGGGATHVTVNITTPDAGSFRQSQGQVASLIARAVERGQRNL
jgi:phage-related minor tail protein